MGQISLLLITPLITAVFGDEPLADIESPDLEETVRVERSQSPYAVFTAFNSVPSVGNTYKPSVSVYQPSAPVYPTYGGGFTYNVSGFEATAYQPEAPAYQPEIQVYQPDVAAESDLTRELAVDGEVPVVIETTAAPTTTTTPAPTFQDIFGFTIADRTKLETDVLRKIFKYLEENEDTASLLKEQIATNPCVNNLEEMLGLIERGGSILETTGPGLELLYQTMSKLRDERNIVPLVRGSADLLLQFEALFPELETFTLFTRCDASPSEGLQSLRDQAQILYGMSLVSDPKFTTELKQNLLRSAIITEVVTNFLDHLRENLAQRDCFTGSDFLGEGTLIVAQVMDDLAEGVGVLGFLPLAKEIRQYSAFTRSIVTNLGKLDDFKILDDCSPGALGRAAENLNSLATLIEETGLEALGVNLGLVFRFDLLP